MMRRTRDSCTGAQSEDGRDSYSDSHHGLFNDLGGGVSRNFFACVLQITDVSLYGIMDVMQRLLSRIPPGGTAWRRRSFAKRSTPRHSKRRLRHDESANAGAARAVSERHHKKTCATRWC